MYVTLILAVGGGVTSGCTARDRACGPTIVGSSRTTCLVPLTTDSRPAITCGFALAATRGAGATDGADVAAQALPPAPAVATRRADPSRIQRRTSPPGAPVTGRGRLFRSGAEIR